MVAECRKIAVLGSTGSIGRQTLDAVREHRDSFSVELLAANTSAELLITQAIEFDAGCVVIGSEALYDEVAEALQPRGIKVFTGAESLAALVAGSNVDMVMAAMTGFAGLRPVAAALSAGKTVALANKEALVAAGELLLRLAEEGGGRILPVDSEHSAIFQCLYAAGGAAVSSSSGSVSGRCGDSTFGSARGRSDGTGDSGGAVRSSGGSAVRKIHLTASGGPFREWSRDRIASATKEEALRHPQWKMGPKVTVDSATLMNKGLEIIEARWLFGGFFDSECGKIDNEMENGGLRCGGSENAADGLKNEAVDFSERINVVVHPESIVHSMVEFVDGAVMAQMAVPDMRIPIQYALSYPYRLPYEGGKMDFAALGSLTFHSPDREKFPALDIAVRALRRGGNIPCVMSAADEVAVQAFLGDRIGFYDVTDVVAECMERAEFIPSPTLEALSATHEEAVRLAGRLIDGIADRRGRR